uniref:Matrix protein n=1 Tax=Wheat rosette stunt virus TaxID=75890 RepID=Q9QAQ3_9RHAB|nr:matrix protein [Wheat rosette stunt virus]
MRTRKIVKLAKVTPILLSHSLYQVLRRPGPQAASGPVTLQNHGLAYLSCSLLIPTGPVKSLDPDTVSQRPPTIRLRQVLTSAVTVSGFGFRSNQRSPSRRWGSSWRKRKTRKNLSSQTDRYTMGNVIFFKTKLLHRKRHNVQRSSDLVVR